MDRDYFSKLHKRDLLARIDDVLAPNGPWIIDPRDNKIYLPEVNISKERNSPWIHVKQEGGRKCKIHTEVTEPYLNFIPFECQNCWKVVFRPQYLKDMLNLLPLMYRLAKKHNFDCKLGAEVRMWTSGVYGKWGLWGCYWYNTSKEQGIFCWETVLNAIAQDGALKHLLDDVDEDGYPARLVLKRGCTEFEIMGKYGDSKDWVYTDENKEWERSLWNAFKEQEMSPDQGQEIRDHVIAYWFKHAHSAGDPTVKELNNGTMLWKSTRFYHKELFESIKKKRAVAKSLKGGGK